MIDRRRSAGLGDWVETLPNGQRVARLGDDPSKGVGASWTPPPAAAPEPGFFQSISDWFGLRALNATVAVGVAANERGYLGVDDQTRQAISTMSNTTPDAVSRPVFGTTSTDDAIRGGIGNVFAADDTGRAVARSGLGSLLLNWKVLAGLGVALVALPYVAQGATVYRAVRRNPKRRRRAS